MIYATPRNYSSLIFLNNETANDGNTTCKQFEEHFSIMYQFSTMYQFHSIMHVSSLNKTFA